MENSPGHVQPGGRAQQSGGGGPRPTLGRAQWRRLCGSDRVKKLQNNGWLFFGDTVHIVYVCLCVQMFLLGICCFILGPPKMDFDTGQAQEFNGLSPG